MCLLRCTHCVAHGGTCTSNYALIEMHSLCGSRWHRYVKTKIASKQLGENSPLKRVDPAKAELYRAWADSAFKKRAANERAASTSDVTTDAIVDALTNPRPKSRCVLFLTCTVLLSMFGSQCVQHPQACEGRIAPTA
jgi:hypothetical protein